MQGSRTPPTSTKKPIQFKSLFVTSSGFDGLGLTLSPDIYNNGAIVTSIEAPLEVAVLVSPPQPTTTPIARETLEAGDVLVQLDSIPVWDTPHSDVVAEILNEHPHGHVLLFLDQMMYYKLRKNDPRRLSSKVVNPSEKPASSWIPSMLSGFSRTQNTPKQHNNLTIANTTESKNVKPPSSLDALLNGSSQGVAHEAAANRRKTYTHLGVDTKNTNSNSKIGVRPGSAHLRSNGSERQKIEEHGVQEQAAADAAMVAGKYTAAIKGYTKALLVDPSNHMIASKRAVAFLKSGKLREACYDAIRCVGTRPEWPMGYLHLGTALEALGSALHLRGACGVYATGMVMASGSSVLATRLNTLVWKLASEGRTLFPGAPVVVLRHPSHLQELNNSLAEQVRNRQTTQPNSTITDLSPAPFKGDESFWSGTTNDKQSEKGTRQPVQVSKLVILGSACNIEALGYYLEPLQDERNCVLSRIPFSDATFDRSVATKLNTTHGVGELTRIISTPEAKDQSTSSWYSSTVLTSAKQRNTESDHSPYVSDGEPQVGDVVQTVNGLYVGNRLFNEIVIEMELATPPLCIGLQQSNRTVESTVDTSEQTNDERPRVSVLVTGYGFPVDGEYIPQEEKNSRLVYQNENGVMLSHEKGLSNGGWVLGAPPLIYATALDKSTTLHVDGAIRKSESYQLRWTKPILVDAEATDTESILWDNDTVNTSDDLIHHCEPVSISIVTAYRLVPDLNGILNSPIQTVEESFQSYMEQFVCGNSKQTMGKQREQWSLRKHALAMKGLAHCLRVSESENFESTQSTRFKMYTAVKDFLERELQVQLPKAPPGTNELLCDVLLNRARLCIANQNLAPDTEIINDLQSCLQLCPGKTEEPMMLLVALLVQQGKISEARSLVDDAQGGSRKCSPKSIERLLMLIESVEQDSVNKISNSGPATAKQFLADQTNELVVDSQNGESGNSPQTADVEYSQTKDFLVKGGVLKKYSKNGNGSAQYRMFHCTSDMQYLVYGKALENQCGPRKSQSKVISVQDLVQVVGFRVTSKESKAMNLAEILPCNRDINDNCFITVLGKTKCWVLEASSIPEKIEWLKHLSQWVQHNKLIVE